MLINITERLILARSKQYAAFGKALDGIRYLVLLNLEFRKGDRTGFWQMKVYCRDKHGIVKVHIHPFIGVVKAFGRIDLRKIEDKFKEFVYIWNMSIVPYKKNWEKLELNFLSKKPNEFKRY